MIKSEKQYNITLEKIKSFQDQLDEILLLPNEDLTVKLQVSAIKGMIETLINEKIEYERTKVPCIIDETFTLNDLPQKLIKARLEQKLTQKELGEKLGIDKNTIQRYETNEYEGVSFDRILEIAFALQMNIQCNRKSYNITFDLAGLDEDTVSKAEQSLQTQSLFQMNL